MKNYKWNKESLLKFIEENNANVEIINGQIENTLLLEVKDFDTMNKLFYGRTCWNINESEREWDNYTNKGQRKQYVWINFNVKEKKGNAYIGFTVEFRPDETFVYAAHDKDDRLVSSVKRDHTVETMKQGLINEGINLETIIKEDN